MNTLTTLFSKPMLAIGILLSIPHFLSSQNNCAIDVVHQHLLETQSGYETQRNAMDAKILNVIQNSTPENERSEIAVIPVVVHILHNGESVGQSVNLTNSQILDGINNANQKWNNTASGVDMKVRFCLATIDPNGNPTSGITRTNASTIPGYKDNGVILSYEPNSNELPLKNLNNWPHDKYYNIWVVSKFNAGWGGYAYFASSVDYEQDGALVVYNGFSNGSLLSHELGHAFNLYHTFQGASNGNCPVNDNCLTQGDKVCDTPPHQQNHCSTSNCESENLANTTSNYMSYCGGLNRFTAGQKARVDATLAYSSRAALVNSNACAGGCSTYPQAKFDFSTNGLIANFINQSLDATEISWDFGDGSTALNFNTISHVYDAPGIYAVSVTAVDACGAVDKSTQNVDFTVLSDPTSNNLSGRLTLSPNPNNGVFNVELNQVFETNIADFVIYDIAGKKLEERQVNFSGSFNEQFENEALAPGMYFLHVQMGSDLSETKQFIVH
jgi:hypothetical protein